MRGVYTVSFFEQTIAAASGDYDLFELTPAAGKPFEIVGIWIANKSEIGDAQEEMVSYSLTRMTGGTFTSGNGSATTPVKTDSADGASSVTAESVGATVATTTGTTEHVHQDTFNIRTGLQLIFPPDMRIKITGQAQEALLVRLRTALADDAVVSGTLYIREV